MLLLPSTILVGDDDIIRLARRDTVSGIPVRDEGRAEVLERLAAGDVVEMAVAVDDVFDRRLGHGLDCVDIGRAYFECRDWAIDHRAGATHSYCGHARTSSGERDGTLGFY